MQTTVNQATMMRQAINSRKHAARLVNKATRPVAAAASNGNGNHVVQHEQEQQNKQPVVHATPARRSAAPVLSALSPFFAAYPPSMASMIRSMEQEMNDMFSAFDTLDLAVPSPGSSVMVPVDVKEDDAAFTITADLPGIPKDDIHVKITQEHVLTISAERTQEHEESEGDFHRIERSYGSFSRSFKLPEGVVDVEAIKAKSENGVLTLVVPKKEHEQPKDKTVHIE